ncbi:hypothetical protein [Adhaeribacter pallidiroseus]|uniref:Outer membrane protein beta-barrel domain-containing protein n=1 Tax=Adhaeribacter pallidiroseus TaxID=2072847 RepID=A0A369QNX6_9BACT|nr:hypothetical protein [Adhaeribacter pallidiroseus]RDC63918.1 hypothetical protein AHMF7616_02527 [Adhaeribacter pallidiroseus]
MKIIYLIWTWFTLLVSINGTAWAQDTQLIAVKRKWYIPNQATLQFAGNIGFVSAGLGYSLRQDKINLDFLYGFTPGFEAQTSIHTLTGKFTYTAWNKQYTSGYNWEILQFGSSISYSFGPQFYTALPKHYPDGYYFWTTSFRLVPFMSTALGKTTSGKLAETGIKRVKAYLEVGTHDLAVLSIVTNKALNPWDIVSFAVGSKFMF